MVAQGGFDSDAGAFTGVGEGSCDEASGDLRSGQRDRLRRGAVGDDQRVASHCTGRQAYTHVDRAIQFSLADDAVVVGVFSDRDYWGRAGVAGKGVDSAIVGSAASITSRVSNLSLNGIGAFSQCLRYIDGISATSQNRCGHGSDGAALGDGQRDSAANRRIGSAGDCRGGVIADCRSIDSDCRSSGIDAIAFSVGCGADVTGGIGGADAGGNGLASVGDQVGTRYVDAEAQGAVGVGHQPGVGIAIDGQGDDVTDFGVATNGAGDGNLLTGFGAVDHVIGGDVGIEGNGRYRSCNVDSTAIGCRTDVASRIRDLSNNGV